MTAPTGRVGAAMIVIAGLMLLLAGAIGWAWSRGSLAEGFAVVTANPWGWVTLLDLYLGLTFVTAWIHAQEQDWRRTAGWAVLLACTGNLATGAYLLWRARRARSAGALWGAAPRTQDPSSKAVP